MGNISVFSTVFCLLILLYASRSDLRTRKVSNILWLAMTAVGIALLGYRTIGAGAPLLVRSGVSVGSTFAVAYLFFRLGLFGAADAKSLLAMSVLFPEYPSLVIFSHRFPISASLIAEPFPFALTTLANGAILALVVPFFLCLRNLFDLGFRAFFPNLKLVFIGYRMPIGQITTSQHIRLAHWYDERDGELKMRFAFRGAEINEAVVARLERYQKQGRLEDKVWVTPDLPFILFITGGFLVAVLVGNLIILPVM